LFVFDVIAHTPGKSVQFRKSRAARWLRLRHFVCIGAVRCKK
jgi:hypothetical protein